MRIAVVCNSLGRGGTERQLSMLLASLSKKHDVALYLVENDRAYRVPAAVHVHWFSRPGSKGFAKLLVYARARSWLNRALCAYKPDIVLSFLELSNVLNLLSLVRAPKVVSVRIHLTSHYKGITGLLMRTLLRLLMPRASLVVANAAESAEDIVTSFGVHKERVRVIPNGIDLSSIHKEAAKPGRTHGRFVLAVGRLTEQKGFAPLIRAFSLVVRAQPDAQLVIVGEGDDRAKLAALVGQLGLQRSVKLLGPKDNPFFYMSRCEVFVLPSLWEGFPNVLLEAMACKAAVVSTACPSGPSEILNAKTGAVSKKTLAKYGVLVPRLDGPLSSERERILADAITELLADDRLRERYRQRAYNRSLDFAAGKSIRQWEEAIARVRRDASRSSG